MKKEKRIHVKKTQIEAVSGYQPKIKGASRLLLILSIPVVLGGSLNVGFRALHNLSAKQNAATLAVGGVYTRTWIDITSPDLLVWYVNTLNVITWTSAFPFILVTIWVFALSPSLLVVLTKSKKNLPVRIFKWLFIGSVGILIFTIISGWFLGLILFTQSKK